MIDYCNLLKVPLNFQKYLQVHYPNFKSYAPSWNLQWIYKTNHTSVEIYKTSLKKILQKIKKTTSHRKFWSLKTRSCLSWARRTCTSCTWRCTRTCRRRWTISWGEELSSTETSEWSEENRQTANTESHVLHIQTHRQTYRKRQWTTNWEVELIPQRRRVRNPTMCQRKTDTRQLVQTLVRQTQRLSTDIQDSLNRHRQKQVIPRSRNYLYGQKLFVWKDKNAFTCRDKHRKNCEYCPMSLLIAR